MLTPNKLGRLWKANKYRQIMREVLAARPEAKLGLDERLGGPLAAAALTLLRLGELNQTSLPLADDLRGRLLVARNRDGSWGEPADRAVLTALCVRALSTLPRSPARRLSATGPTLGLAEMFQTGDVRSGDAATAAAIRGGVAYLADAQRDDGGWGQDERAGFDTAFVMLQVGRLESFKASVRLEDALRFGRSPRRDAATEGGMWNRMRMRGGQAMTLGPRPAPAARPNGPKRDEGFVFAEVA